MLTGDWVWEKLWHHRPPLATARLEYDLWVPKKGVHWSLYRMPAWQRDQVIEEVREQVEHDRTVAATETKIAYGRRRDEVLIEVARAIRQKHPTWTRWRVAGGTITPSKPVDTAPRAQPATGVLS